MAVLIDLEIDADDFDLGRVTAGDEDIHIKLDRVVPTGNEVMPFFWAEGDDFEAFERRVRNERIVDELEALERVEDQILYKVTWGTDVHNFTRILTESGATILEAHGNTPWVFKLRFATHSGLRDFHNLCREQDIGFRVNSISTELRPADDGVMYRLTARQHETIVTAVQEGYFEVPRRISLQDLSEEFDVSPQAVSERLRRAENEVLRTVLLPTSARDLD